MLLVLVVVPIAVAVALVAYDALATAHDRSQVRAALRSLDDYQPADLREQELMAPLSQRVLQPIARTFVALGRRVMPLGYMDRVREKLVIAGRPGPEDLDRFRALRVATIAATPVALIASLAMPLPARQQLFVFAFLAFALVLGPDAVLNRQMAERQTEIRRRLPDMLDLLTISVEAGLGFEQALERTAVSVPGPLSDEFRRLLGELGAGAGRADAFRALDTRTQVPELRSFVLAVIQADTFGVSIARILRAQADEMRVKRRQIAQEEAQKAPVKLLFPMVLCVFPGLFVVLLGPAMLDYVGSGF